tara:strand:+ start:597 stop:1124 length:528 start_codon:yes stop_codon:yes gene_type:complete
MLNHRLGIESIDTSDLYFNAMSGYFYEQDISFIDGLYWDKNGVSSSENIQGYVIQGDLFWDDVYAVGMIDMFHQTQKKGYISDIYDPSHAVWGGCGYGWDQEGTDSIETSHNISFGGLFYELNNTFDMVDFYFGHTGTVLEGIDTTEDFSEFNLPSELFEEKTPTAVSGWTKRGI